MLLQIKEFFINNKKLVLVSLVVLVVIATPVYLSIVTLKSWVERNNRSNSQKYVSDTITGFDVIEKKFKSGEIDNETRLVSKVKLAFNADKTYITQERIFEDGGALNEITKNYSKLSEKTKKALEPYFKRPNDKDSYLYKKVKKLKVVKTDKKFGIIGIAFANERPTSSSYGDVFRYLYTPDKKIKVWYYHDEEAGYSDSLNKVFYDEAKQVVTDLVKNTVYAKLSNLLKATPPSDKGKGGDDALDIYLDPTNKLLKEDNSKADGLNVPDISNGVFYGSSFIIIDSNVSNNELKSTIVHEIFHAFQRVYPLDNEKDNWWIEASAVWSENYIYPNLNLEQSWVSDFIPFPTKSLASIGGNKEYGAYVFPLYLSKKYGDSIIYKIFKASEISTGDSIASTIAYQVSNGNASVIKDFKEFTLWNYNINPVQKYKLADKSGKFPTDSSGGNVIPKNLDFGKDLEIKTNKLDPLSAEVITIDNFITDKKVNKVEFTNLWNDTAGIASIGKGVKAIIYPKKGNAYVEDWTNKFTRDFCLNKSQENFKSITLIFSNGLVDTKSAQPNFLASVKKNSKDCKEKEKKDTGKWIISGGDSRIIKSVHGLPGKEWVESNTCTYSFSGKQIGDPIGAKIPQYPWVDRYRITVTSNCGKTLSEGEIDLTYTMALLYTLVDSKPTVNIDSKRTWKTGTANPGIQQTYYYGWLDKYTANGAEIHLPIYAPPYGDGNYGTVNGKRIKLYDTHEVILKVSK